MIATNHPVHRIPVEFSGPGEGVDELSWGQREIWGGMAFQRSWFPIGGVRPLPAGTTVDEVVAELRYSMGRFPTMRTTFLFDRGPDRPPRQVLHRSGVTALEVVDAGDDDPADVAEATRRRYVATDYDFVTDWPVRMAVVRQGDALTHLVAVLCHLVTDGFGSRAMLDHVAERSAADPDELPPLAQVRWQRGPAGRRQTDAVLRHWEPILRVAAPDRFPPAGPRAGRLPAGPRFADGTYHSPAMALTVPALAARHRADTATVLLAAFAVALLRVARVNPVVFRLVVHNRFRPGLARVVAPINQTGLFAVDLDGTDLAGALTRTARASRTATKYAYYDPEEVDALVARVNAERGETVNLQVFFNDRRLDERAAPTPHEPDPGALARTRDRDTLTWTAFGDGPGERLFVHVEDDRDAVTLTLTTDTHHLPLDDAESLLRTMQDVTLRMWDQPAGSVR